MPARTGVLAHAWRGAPMVALPGGREPLSARAPRCASAHVVRRYPNGQDDALGDLATIERACVSAQIGSAHDATNGAHGPGERGRAGDSSQPAPGRRLDCMWRVFLDVNDVGAGEVLLLAVHPIDRAGPAAQTGHRRAPSSANAPLRPRRTLATGSRAGDEPGPRPLARIWASPCGRPSDRLPASQGTRP